MIPSMAVSSLTLYSASQSGEPLSSSFSVCLGMFDHSDWRYATTLEVEGKHLASRLCSL